MKGTIGPVAIGGPFPTVSICPPWSSPRDPNRPDAVPPVLLYRPSVQFLGRHEPAARTMASYGKNWERLAVLKRKYDPDCFFKNNFWPLDKDGAPLAPLENEPPSP